MLTKEAGFFIIAFLQGLLIGTVVTLLCTSCTLSFTNVSTHGTASDVVDDELTNKPDTNLEIPLSKL